MAHGALWLFSDHIHTLNWKLPAEDEASERNSIALLLACHAFIKHHNFSAFHLSHPVLHLLLRLHIYSAMIVLFFFPTVSERIISVGVVNSFVAIFMHFLIFSLSFNLDRSIILRFSLVRFFPRHRSWTTNRFFRWFFFSPLMSIDVLESTIQVHSAMIFSNTHWERAWTHVNKSASHSFLLPNIY